MPLKVVRAVRGVLSQLTRTRYRAELKAALASNNSYQRSECLAAIDFDSVELTPDTGKLLAFQLAQTIALIDGRELYTKGELKTLFPDCAPLIDRAAGGAPGQLNLLRDELLRRLKGVYVRQKGDLNLFMYGNALAIDDWNQFARQSRGMIIDVKRERCVAFPMDKFFRFGEGPELGRDALPAETEVEVVEKADGSMVSLVWHDGQIAFSCKGNFDTEQSRRAAAIAQRLPVAQLRLDRFHHVFEVIYPENRFPQGLSIVDYGDREALVLTAMRDRSTNRLLSYSEVIAEAQRVGLSHPASYPLDLDGAFREVDRAPMTLTTEGFVIRTRADGRYFKLKYPAYKLVLKLVNDMRSNRFVREYFDQSPAERAGILAILPRDIRAVAEEQLGQHARLAAALTAYSQSKAQSGPADRKAFADFVAGQVPEPYRKLVFLTRRGGEVSLLIEGLATAAYHGEIAMPDSNGGSLSRLANA